MKARRATFDDLPQLTALWELERLPSRDLEKRFTEFQVVVDEANAVLAAIGLQVSGHHGLLHSEVLGRPELGDQARAMLWERIQMVARNHSLDRVWTRLNLPFWRSTGFRSVQDEELDALPEVFGEKDPALNLLWLRPETASGDAIEKQFAMLRALHTQEREQLGRHVSVIKKVALVLMVLVGILVVAWAVVLMRYGPQFLNRQ